jgi:hypothetical protein
MHDEPPHSHGVHVLRENADPGVVDASRSAKEDDQIQGTELRRRLFHCRSLSACVRFAPIAYDLWRHTGHLWIYQYPRELPLRLPPIAMRS